jgi:hypothetical protein
MAEFTKMSQEYWRPALSGDRQSQTRDLQTPGNAAYCTTCGTRYAVGERFCYLCGPRGEDTRTEKWSGLSLDSLDLEGIRKQTGLSTISLVFVLAAAVFLLATMMTGLVHSPSTTAEWQALQTWRIEWLLGTVVALLAAILFKPKA